MLKSVSVSILNQFWLSGYYDLTKFIVLVVIVITLNWQHYWVRLGQWIAKIVHLIP